MGYKWFLLGGIGGALGIGAAYGLYSRKKKQEEEGKPASKDATTVDVEDDDTYIYGPWTQASSVRTSRTLGGRRRW